MINRILVIKDLDDLRMYCILRSSRSSMGGASRPPMGNSASLNSSVLRLIFGNKQTMLNAKTIGFLLIIMSNHDLHPYHEEIGR